MVVDIFGRIKYVALAENSNYGREEWKIIEKMIIDWNYFSYLIT